MPPRTKKFKRILGVLFIICTVLFVIAEISLRVLYKDLLQLQSYPMIYQPDSLYGYTYIPDIKGRICRPSICKDFLLNENGFNGPAFDEEKPSNTFRIAVVCGSVGSGIWLAGDTSYPMMLQKLFAENGYPNVEVVNFSIDGKYREIYNARMIEEVVPRYRPDLVLFNTDIPFIDGFVRRDVYKDYVLVYSKNYNSRQYTIDKVDYLEKYSFLTPLYEASYIARAAVLFYIRTHRDRLAYNLNLYTTKRIEGPARYFPLSVKRTLIKIKAARAATQCEGGELALFRFQPDEQFEETCNRHGIPCIILKVPYYKELTHEYDSHYNTKGHRIIAQKLFDALVCGNYIPGTLQ